MQMSHCLQRFWFWPLSRNTNPHLISAEMEQSFSSLECYTLWRNNRHKRQPSSCLETWLGPLQQVGVKVLSGKKKAIPLVRFAMPMIPWKWSKVHNKESQSFPFCLDQSVYARSSKKKGSIRFTLMTITPWNGWQNCRRIVCTKWKIMEVNSVAYRDFWLWTSKMVPWKWPAFIQKFDYHLNQRILWISRGYKTNCFWR